MLKDLVQLSVNNCPNGIFKNMKRPAPNMASGTDPNRIMNGSRKLLNCAARTRKISTSESKNTPRNLLPSIERPRDGFVVDGSDRAQRDELVVRSAHVNIFQLLRIQAIDALYLRNHLVTAPFDVEPVDIIAADTRRDIGA